MCTPIYKSTKNQEINGRLQTKKIALSPERKPYRIGLLFTHKNGDFSAIAATELRCADLESGASQIAGIGSVPHFGVV